MSFTKNLSTLLIATCAVSALAAPTFANTRGAPAPTAAKKPVVQASRSKRDAKHSKKRTGQDKSRKNKPMPANVG
jgi:hypothetical protein